MKTKYALSLVVLFSLSFIINTHVIAVKFKLNPLVAIKDSCDSAGVFLTHEDYVNKKLSFKVYPDRKGHRLVVSFNRKDIKIIRPDTVVDFKGGSIYGYYNCGEKMRYSKKGYYNIAEKSPLVIYTVSVNNFSGMTEVKYYYSIKSDSEIRGLTLKNIEKDFKNKPAFVTEVKNRFKWWSGLAATDDNGKLLFNELWGEYKYRNEETPDPAVKAK